MNPCCEHLYREALKEIKIRDNRIKELQDECTRLFEPTREFWNGTALKNLNDKYERQVENSNILVEALEKILSSRTCKTHKLGECPSSDENNLYIPAWKALKQYRGEE
jgi:hypothetical protein